MQQQTYNPTRHQLTQLLASGEVESNNFRRRTDWRIRWKKHTGNSPTTKPYRVVFNITGPAWLPICY